MILKMVFASVMSVLADPTAFSKCINCKNPKNIYH